ncbi:MAG: hypothetical protein RLZZ306_1708 [Bacteroidota bacterium]|jgi:hypothetical protein
MTLIVAVSVELYKIFAVLSINTKILKIWVNSYYIFILLISRQAKSPKIENFRAFVK